MGRPNLIGDNLFVNCFTSDASVSVSETTQSDCSQTTISHYGLPLTNEDSSLASQAALAISQGDLDDLSHAHSSSFRELPDPASFVELGVSMVPGHGIDLMPSAAWSVLITRVVNDRCFASSVNNSASVSVQPRNGRC